MPNNFFEILAFSIMIGLFIIGYIRDGYLEGLKLSSYSFLLITTIGFLIYYMNNAQSIEKLIYNPVTKEISFVNYQPKYMVSDFCFYWAF